jgi:hypothetical protein
MKQELGIIACVLGLLFIVNSCESPVDSSSDDLCYYIGEYGEIHRYPCGGSNYGGGGYSGGGTNIDSNVVIVIQLPDTAKNWCYGLFFITDTTTYECKYLIEGKCNDRRRFYVYSSSIPEGEFYLAVLVSSTQTPPIKFTPQLGNYLGWYGGEGIYPAIKSSFEYPNAYLIYVWQIL